MRVFSSASSTKPDLASALAEAAGRALEGTTGEARARCPCAPTWAGSVHVVAGRRGLRAHAAASPFTARCIPWLPPHLPSVPGCLEQGTWPPAPALHPTGFVDFALFFVSGHEIDEPEPPPRRYDRPGTARYRIPTYHVQRKRRDSDSDDGSEPCPARLLQRLLPQVRLSRSRASHARGARGRTRQRQHALRAHELGAPRRRPPPLGGCTTHAHHPLAPPPPPPPAPAGAPRGWLHHRGPHGRGWAGARV